MEEEDLKEDTEVATLYENFANLATQLMNAVSMSIYKTAMSEEDYDKMAELIYDLRHEVQTFTPVEEISGTIH